MDGWIVGWEAGQKTCQNIANWARVWVDGWTEGEKLMRSPSTPID